MRLIWRFLRYPVYLLLFYFAGILVYGTLTDWKPTGDDPLAPVSGGSPTLDTIKDPSITLLTWNVGYGGLGAEDYFFYNRGDFFWTDLGRARSPRTNVERYVAGQRLTVANTESDIFLLQEVDRHSRRSYYTDQVDTVVAARPEYSAYYAPNFRSRRVPIPLLQPWDHYGEVESGLVSLAGFPASSAERLQLPGEHPWPTRLFQLDRCALRQVFPTAWGKELVVYNIHLSAYDADGSLRRQQMDFLRERVLADYGAGRYVIVGGDWNQVPPGFNWFSLNPTVEEAQLPPAIAFDYFPPGWAWGYDPGDATVRTSDTTYDAHRSRRSVIDYYLCSPDVRLHLVRAINQDFRFSDHQPVYLEAELMRN
ncbi:endonuclease/exonuclease/phosphatase family protein [Lewinella sp. IMCC34183]|uniref:endonuclease/exonuclease/phosphatase family protein n=1 Tax=Lewinella sp. IMCC34183 TaxID=2248762 RepID=UPI000E229ECA|nr:endonuclease/exonuclease/phosphatase family protein [Lewinella sp. IMCC34183]